MAIEIASKVVTEEEYLALGADVRAEVIDGELIIDMAANKYDHSLYGQRFGTLLDVFVTAHKLGRVGGDMTAFKLKGGKRTLKDARVPDVSYVSYERFPREAEIDILPVFAPDLAVEIISASESRGGILKKTEDYLNYGTLMVVHVVPFLDQIQVFTPANRAGMILNIDDIFSGGDVLPGFEIPVRVLLDLTDEELHANTLRRLLAI